MRTGLRFAVSIAALVAIAAPSALAGPGTLDPSFGNRGIATVFHRGAGAYAVVVDHHGRVDVAGSTLPGDADIALARFGPKGNLDPTFGADGKVVTDLGGNDYAFGMAVQRDGRIVVVGERDTGTGSQLAIVRYRTDGSLDPTFGSNGVVLTSFGHRFQAGDAVALEPKGRIVVVGWTSNGTTTRSAIARFLTGGALDPSFGGDGRITLDLSRSDEQFDAIQIQPDGFIVVAGNAESRLVPQFCIVRFTATGALDSGFGADGVVRLDVSRGPDDARALSIESGGDILVAGSAGAGGADEWAIAKLGPKGHLDRSFGTKGLVLSSFGPGYDAALGMAIQANGKVVVVGRIHGANRGDLGAVRYLVGGAKDTTFGTNGHVIVDVAGGDDVASAIAIGADRRIVVAGSGIVDRRRRFVLARLLPI